MLRKESVSSKMAQATNMVAAKVLENGRGVTDGELDAILESIGVVTQNQSHKSKLIKYGYLQYGQDRAYSPTAEGGSYAEITIRVTPSLFANEVRTDLVQHLAAFAGIIEVGEVEL